MNPPPYQPPPTEKSILVRQILKASLIAVPVAALMVFLVIHAIAAQKKAVASRAAWQNVKSSAGEIHDDLKKNFDPKTGVTNVDLGKFEKMRKELKNASQNSSGDDASFAEVMTGYVDRMQFAVKNYQVASAKLREAHVLNQFDSSDKEQIAARREVVQQFIEANTALKRVITNSEDQIRADLIQAKVPDSKIDRFLTGFHTSSAPKTALTVKIRQCDDRIGDAMLHILNMLDTERDHWQANPATDEILFKSGATREAYNDALASIKAASDEQLRLQKILVNQPPVQP